MIYEINANTFLEYVDRFLAGEKDICSVENAEIDNLLQLAKLMITADFSNNNTIKEDLKKKLLAETNKSGIFMVSKKNDDELTEEDLDYVVAGFSGQIGAQSDICPHCGASITNSNGRCSFCNQ